MQRAAEAIYTPEGQRQVAETIAYYHRNAAMLREGLASQGLEVYGGTDAPYIWVRTPEGMSSWDFFYLLLERCHVVCTPGVGFGPSGEGYRFLVGRGYRTGRRTHQTSEPKIGVCELCSKYYRMSLLRFHCPNVANCSPSGNFSRAKLLYHYR